MDHTQVLPVPEETASPQEVVVIVPVYNEEATIGRVIQEITALLPLPGYRLRILVVDGHSRDATVEAATLAGAEVVLQRGKGYGAACYTGFQQTAPNTILIYLDGDYSDPPAAIPGLLAEMKQQKADLVLGSRSLGQSIPGALPRHAVWGNRLVTGMISLIYHQHFSDLPSMKAIRRESLTTFDMQEMAYGWTTEMLVKATRAGCRIREVPINYRSRDGGQSKVSGNWQASFKAGYQLIRTAWRYSGWRPTDSTPVARNLKVSNSCFYS